MLKLLFNRDSGVVRLLEIIGLINSCLVQKRIWPLSHALGTCYFFLLVSYLFVRLCDFISWYSRDQRSSDRTGLAGRDRIGIEVHFKMARVPAAYILAITSLICLPNVHWLAWPFVMLSLLMMLVIASVNGIQIYFHLRDHDSLPINYFSRHDKSSC